MDRLTLGSEIKIEEVVESEMMNTIEECVLTLFESNMFRRWRTKGDADITVRIEHMKTLVVVIIKGREVDGLVFTLPCSSVSHLDRH